MIQFVAIFSIPRTGTNHLCSLLAQVQGLQTHYELFSPKESYYLPGVCASQIARENDLPTSDRKDSRFTDFARANPASVLNSLADNSPAHIQAVVFKVFPGHLEQNVIVDQLLAREDVAVVFVQRNPLDSYISSQKVPLAGRYSRVDTSDLKVELNFEDFNRWYQDNSHWYRSLDQAFGQAGKAPLFLSYEQDIAVPADETVDRFLAGLKGFDISLTRNAPARSWFIKQDRSADYRAKISNFEEFFEQLERSDLRERATSYFVEPRPSNKE